MVILIHEGGRAIGSLFHRAEGQTVHAQGCMRYSKYMKTPRLVIVTEQECTLDGEVGANS